MAVSRKGGAKSARRTGKAARARPKPRTARARPKARKSRTRSRTPARSRAPAVAKASAGPVDAAPVGGPRKVTTFFTFPDHGEEAVKLYVSLFGNSRINNITRWGPGGPVSEGALQHASFQLDGVRFMAMDGGSYFSFGQGFSLFVNCETQEEIDTLWEKLSDGGAPQMCGWVKDRYGVSWQVVPTALGTMMGDRDPVKAKRVTEAMLKMVKLDIAALRAAYEG